MSTTAKPKCPSGGTPTYFNKYNGYTGTCNCHGSYVSCNGTEQGSYCLLGCSSCCTLISAKNEREKTHLETLEKKIADLEKANAERPILDQLNGGFHYAQIFQSQIIAVKLTHPKAGPVGTTYNLHLNRLAAVSSHFRTLSTQFTTKPSYKSKDYNPVAFKNFVEFLYSGDYVLPASHNQVACYIHTLVYFLADTLGAPDLKDLAKDKLTKCLKDAEGKQPGDAVVVKMVDATYDGTSDDLKLAGLDTGVMVTPCSSTKGDDSDAESDTGTEVPEDGTATPRHSAPASGGNELDDTLASLDLDETSELSVDTISDPHPMRLLVSRYAASRMEALNKRSDFRTLLRRFPEFTVDMMIAKEAMAKEKEAS